LMPPAEWGCRFAFFHQQNAVLRFSQYISVAIAKKLASISSHYS
jgi:hypothetical protein